MRSVWVVPAVWAPTGSGVWFLSGSAVGFVPFSLSPGVFVVICLVILPWAIFWGGVSMVCGLCGVGLR